MQSTFPQQIVLSPKQVARAIGVSEASLKRWCDKGKLISTKTVGGHRRLHVSNVLRFLKDTGRELVRPEVLGLPPSTRKSEWTQERGAQQLFDALALGDEDMVLQVVFDLYVAGFSVCEICDKIMTQTFHEIGRAWEHGTVQIYQERRAASLCARALQRLEQFTPPLTADAPRAFGATLASDPYTLPTAMASVVLREIGWRATSFGVGLPTETLCDALSKESAQLFWVSVSSFDSDPVEFLADFSRLYNAASAREIPVVVGGRALTPELRKQMRFAAFGDNMAHLVDFGSTIYRATRREGVSA
ncbi:MAG: helix-turn-helix domain-containing protein [Planctomycetes bacterium]|nr:helix-turn-helix domain-containing protein [Planctomycetota bacterium]